MQGRHGTYKASLPPHAGQTSHGRSRLSLRSAFDDSVFEPFFSLSRRKPGPRRSWTTRARPPLGPDFRRGREGGCHPVRAAARSGAGQTRDLQSEPSIPMRIRPPTAGPGSPLRSAFDDSVEGFFSLSRRKPGPRDRGASAVFLPWAPTCVGEESLRRCLKAFKPDQEMRKRLHFQAHESARLTPRKNMDL